MIDLLAVIVGVVVGLLIYVATGGLFLSVIVGLVVALIVGVGTRGSYGGGRYP